MTAYIINFKANTPDNVKEETYKQIEAEGGVIKQKYTLIPGFAVTLPKEQTVGT